MYVVMKKELKPMDKHKYLPVWRISHNDFATFSIVSLYSHLSNIFWTFYSEGFIDLILLKLKVLWTCENSLIKAAETWMSLQELGGHEDYLWGHLSYNIKFSTFYQNML